MPDFTKKIAVNNKKFHFHFNKIHSSVDNLQMLYNISYVDDTNINYSMFELRDGKWNFVLGSAPKWMLELYEEFVKAIEQHLGLQKGQT